ncbi:MAG: hypothetical protein V4760_04230 [Bdellovibrionota bacterium]
MKPAISKQAALKALLLTALAANITWEPFKALQSYDAAQVSSESVAATGSGSRAADNARLTAAPGAQPAGRVAPAAPVAPVAPAAARTTRESTPVTTHSETRSWCGVEFTLRWEKLPNENRLRGEVIRRFPENQVMFTYVEIGEFSSHVLDDRGRQKAIDYMEENTRPKLSSCVSIASGSNTSAGTNTSAQTDEQRRRLEADVKNCKKTSDGKPLDSTTRLECNQERLTSIDPIDEDDRKSKRDSQAQFNTIVKAIQGDLRKEVKESLLSDDEASARQLVDDAIEAITEAGREIEISSTIVNKAVNDIRKMYGAEYKGKELRDFNERTKGQADELRSQADMWRSEFETYNDGAHPYEAMYASTQLNAVLGQGLTLNTVYNRAVDTRIGELRGYQRSNWIDPSDFTDWTQGTDDLRRELAFFKNGGRMTTQGPPTADQLTMGPGFMQGRADAANRYREVYGNIPVRPTLNFTPSANSPSAPTPTFTNANPRLGNRI